MLKLFLPCSVSREKQIISKVKILEQYEKRGFRVGIEVFSADDLFDPAVVKKCEANLEKWLPPTFDLSLHAPFFFKDQKVWKNNYFSSKQGLEKLIYIFSLADRLGAKFITIHASMFYSYSELRMLSGNEMIRRKKEHIARIKHDLILARIHYPHIKICIENMPFPWGEDRWLNPEENIYDPCFVDLADFQEIVDPAQNIFIALDTSHLAANLDSSQMLKEIKKIGPMIGHVQFSDLSGHWKPFFSLADEGVIPGDGRIGERVCRELLTYFLKIAEKQHDLGIELEVSNQDYEDPEECEVALKRIVSWIEDIRKLKK